jgi:hypothetical protein
MKSKNAKSMNNLEKFAGFQNGVCRLSVREILQPKLRTLGSRHSEENRESGCVCAGKL